MAPDGAENLSPVKRALIEIGRLRERCERLEAGRGGCGGCGDPIAVIGIGCRFPGGADGPASFWRLLAEGRDAIGPVPPERWPQAEWFDPDPRAPGKTHIRLGGFLDGIDRFDADFFGISPREAAGLDPQQRLLLEVAWEALENAAVAPDRLAGSATGVFVGISGTDFMGAQLKGLAPRDIDVYLATGSTHSVAAGRLAYQLGLQGPALAVDAACSSSLLAVHLACQSLRAGECSLALAGGVGVLLLPEVFVNFSKAGMLAPDGRCKFGDAAADGYVRGEGCGVIVLKPLAAARAAGDPVLAVIRSSAVNQDGRSSGLTVPNGPAQQALIRRALELASVGPNEIGYIEAHGTGTALGDPIELQALGGVFGPGRAAPLPVGSVKSNVGHLEAAAGMAGLIKLVLALRRGQIPPSLHVARPTPRVDWTALNLRIPSGLEPWPAEQRIGGVSAFGFSGTNVHVIVQAGSPPAVAPAGGAGERLFVLSAQTDRALAELAARWAEALTDSGLDFDALCRTAALGRAHFGRRLALVVRDVQDLREKLARDDRSSDGTGALDEIAARYLRGDEVDWTALFDPAAPRLADLPAYPFQRARHWPELARAQRPGSPRLWELAREAATRQAAVAPLDLEPQAYPARWQALDRLALAHIVGTLRSFGVFSAPGERWPADALVARLAIAPVYRDLVGRWLARLADENILSRDGGAFTSVVPLPEPDLTDARESARGAWAGEGALLDYLDRCGRSLAGVLTGRLGALETLFPNGSTETADWMYRDWPVARYFNGIVRAVVESLGIGWPAGRTLRLVEIGAGTGGTTAGLLGALPPDRAEYFFTDVSAGFFAAAESKFAAWPFVRFQALDIERDPAEQGFGAHGFDIAIAANVLHAARDLAGALENVRGLLAPGGLLLLYETTAHPIWFDVSIALIEGWHRFDDAWREGNPLLGAQKWEALLRERGFERVLALPQAGSPAVVLPNRVIVAQAPDSAVASCPETVAAVQASPCAGVPENDDFIQKVRGADPSEARERLVDFVRGHVSRILRLEPGREIDRRARLMDRGVDSLMAVELRNRLGKGLGLARPLPATLIFNYPTCEAIAEYLARDVLRLGDDAAPPALEALSEEDAARLMTARLDALEGKP